MKYEIGLDKTKIKDLRLLVLAVAFGMVCFTITGGVAMTGFLKDLGVSDFVYGLIFAIGPITAVLQLYASYVLERTKKRKFMFIFTGLISRISWLPFGLVPLFIPISTPILRIWMVVLILMVGHILTPFSNVSFYSFIVDMVPLDIRGRYFSFRYKVLMVFGLFAGLLNAFILDRVFGFNGYAIVFTIAAIFGVADIVIFFFVKIPPMEDVPKKEKISTMIADVFKNKRYMRIIIYGTVFYFTLSLTAPFGLVYAKTVLNLSFMTITFALTIPSTLTSVLFLSAWGRALDRYGNKPIMRISAALACISPIFWMFTFDGPYAVITLIFAAGIGTSMIAGLDLGLQNVFLAQSPEKNRSMYMAMFL